MPVPIKYRILFLIPIILPILIIIGLVLFPKMTAFILIASFLAFFPLIQRNFEINMFKTNTRSAFKNYTILYSTKTLLYFLQYFLLTSIFPYQVLIVLIILLFIGNFFHQAFGAISGFSLKVKDEKIRVITLLNGLKTGVFNKKTPYIDIIYALLFLGSIVTCISIYYNDTISYSNKLVFISIYVFILQEFFQLILEFFFRYRIISSEFFDDDFRNFYLSTSFSNIFYAIFLFLSPYLIFQPNNMEFITFFKDWPIWYFVIPPLLIFMLFQVYPFIIGSQKYRNQHNEFIENRFQILQNLISLSNLPFNKETQKELEKITRDLINKSNILSNSSWALQIFQKIEKGKITIDTYRKKKGMLRVQNTVRDLLNNEKDLVKYDSRVAQLKFYEKLIYNIKTNRLSEIKEYLVSLLSEVKESKEERKNYIIPILSSSIGTLLIYLIKTFSDELMKIIDVVVPK